MQREEFKKLVIDLFASRDVELLHDAKELLLDLFRPQKGENQALDSLVQRGFTVLETNGPSFVDEVHTCFGYNPLLIKEGHHAFEETLSVLLVSCDFWRLELETASEELFHETEALSLHLFAASALEFFETVSVDSCYLKLT